MHGYNDKDLPNSCTHTCQDSSSALPAGMGSAGVDVDADVQLDPGPDRPAAATSVSHPARSRPRRSHVARQRQLHPHREPRLPTHVQSGSRGTAPEHPSRLPTCP